MDFDTNRTALSNFWNRSRRSRPFFKHQRTRRELLMRSLTVESLESRAMLTAGDFNDDGTAGLDDIDRLTVEVRAQSHDVSFDLNADGEVNSGDRIVWIKSIRKTFFGDSNLDGKFDSSDLVKKTW